MKKFVLLSVCTVLSVLALAQYKVVDNRSSVKFTIKNFGINVGGSFAGLEGNISFDPLHPETAAFRVSIDAATVNTDNDLRDSHLKAENYFDAGHYPRIAFESVKITATTKKGIFMMYGKLTIKNQSKDITFPFTADALAGSWLFKGTFTINRRDFNVGGASIISDNANITLEVVGGK